MATVVDVSGGFSGVVASYAAASSDETVLGVSVEGSVVSLSGVAAGSASVTVTATNTSGSVSQSFEVTVQPAAPTSGERPNLVEVWVGAVVHVDVSSAFAGTVESYGARAPIGGGRVRLSVTGSVVSITGMAPGVAVVSVLASNAAGTADSFFGVRVIPPAAPATAATLVPQTLTAGDMSTVDVAAGFAGAVDTYSATSSNTAVLTVSASGSVVTLTGVAAGTATVTVTATNTVGSATQTIDVTVNPSAPTTIGTLGDQTVTAAATATVDGAAGFTGAVGTYSATSSDTAVLTVSTTGSVVTLTGVAAGTATVTVTVTNTGGSATQSFDVTVAPAAPAATGTLAAQTVTAGDSVDVDVAGAFSGTVDSYVVTSSNGAVLDVALVGSVVTLTGVAAGTATVTVTATNTAGSATQTLAVTVNLPPAPTLGAQLSAQTLQVTETRTVDIASGFNGRIDTYTAVAGDTDTLTVTVDGSAVSLRGVAVGSTTVTVTAINAAGRAARSFNVTVNALTAPQTASTPTARTIAVGAELPIHIADAFSGIVHTYTATSSDTTKLTTSADGSTVTLVGVAAGTTTVTLTAANTAGRATQTFTATVETPEELAIAVAAPSHCLGSEGTLAPGGGRRGVGHIDLTYHITGGAGPYTITSPDAPGTTHTEPSGTLRIPCAQRGIDLTTAGPEVNVVEAGPRTLTLTATDNTATTTTTNIQIEIAENAYTTEYNGGQMHPGKTYILGTPTQWVLITLPAGLTLQFTGLSEHNTAHFTEPTTGAEIIFDWTTGTEIGRIVPTTTTARSTTRTTATKQATTTTTPTITTLLTALRITKPAGVTYGASSTEWRPYSDLPDGAEVAVHKRMLIGEPIRVCATPSTDTAFKRHVEQSAEAWNDRITVANTSFPRDLFTFHQSCTITVDVGVKIKADLEVKRVVDADISAAKYCGRVVPGCARILVTGINPPTIGGREIIVKASLATDSRVMIHELGHFLGLGDFFEANRSKCDTPTTTRPTHNAFASVMAGGNCLELTIQDRDLLDLHKIYDPGARTGMYFDAVGSSGWELNPGDPPPDTGEGKDGVKYVSNAAAYVIFRRAFGSVGPHEYVGRFSRSASRVIPGAQLKLDSDREQIEGYVFRVYGVTGGDIEQSSSPDVANHATRPFDLGLITGSVGSRDWTLGTEAKFYGPPKVPMNVRTETRDSEVDVVWDHVVSATDYDVYWHDTANAIDQPTTTGGDPASSLGKQNVRASTRTSCGMRVTIDNGLVNGTKYYFRVRANKDGVELRGRLSVEVSGRPHVIFRPRGSSAGLSGGVVKAASADSCTVDLPEEVDPVVEHECPTGDGLSWVLRGVDGGDWWCDRVESADVVSAMVWWCAASAGVVSVGADGVPMCELVEGGTVRSRLGPPECGEGFSLVTVLAMGVPARVCSRTDTEEASASVAYSCEEEGYTLSGAVCTKSVPATAATTVGCEEGFSLVTVLAMGAPTQVCRRSVPATANTTYSCASGYDLVTFFVMPGVSGRRCEKTVSATSSTTYSCRSGYTLVTTVLPIGAVARQCEKTVAATATYSCSSGYTLSGTSCYKYVYTSPNGTTCPASYTLIYNGLFYLCRKKVTTTAAVTYSCRSGTLSGSRCILTARPTSTVTYSCRSGRLSGSRCILTARPTSTVTYSCRSGRLSGSRCILTARPTSTTTYSCRSGRLSGSRCILTARPTSTTTYSCRSGTLSGSNCILTARPTSTTTYSCRSGTLSGSNCILTARPTSTTTYDCDNAPEGFTLSGQDCVKTTTKPPTRPTIYYCDPGYTPHVESADGTTTCTRTIITNANKTIVEGCPAVPPGEPPYQLTITATATGTTRTCTRTITIAATASRSCPTGYNPVITVGEDGFSFACRLDRDTTTTPPTS